MALAREALSIFPILLLSCPLLLISGFIFVVCLATTFLAKVALLGCSNASKDHWDKFRSDASLFLDHRLLGRLLTSRRAWHVRRSQMLEHADLHSRSFVFRLAFHVL
jgi:hypothetical protein